MTSPKKSLEDLAEVVAPEVLLDAIQTSRTLADLGVPHALIGGLAVGLHGHPRATKDVDFYVGKEAYEMTFPLLIFRDELKDIARVGEIDFLYPTPEREDLLEFLELPKGDKIPVIPVPALVVLKLDAGRRQDLADVQALLQAGVDTAEIVAFLNEHAPEHKSRFAELMDESGD